MSEYINHCICSSLYGINNNIILTVMVKIVFLRVFIQADINHTESKMNFGM